MTQYRVELTGEASEVYIVEADSEQEARDNWMHGWQQVSECSGMEVVSVQMDID